MWILPADGGEPTAVTSAGEKDTNCPAWSPDGEWIAVKRRFTDASSIGSSELWLHHRRGRWWPGQHPGVWPLLIGAAVVGSGYALVIGTMRVIPAAYAVALSNLGIVVAALLSVLVFREREHAAQRLTWATLLAASLLLIAVQV